MREREYQPIIPRDYRKIEAQVRELFGRLCLLENWREVTEGRLASHGPVSTGPKIRVRFFQEAGLCFFGANGLATATACPPATRRH